MTEPGQWTIGRNGGISPPFTVQLGATGTWRLIQGVSSIELSPNQAAELAGMMLPEGWKLVRLQ